MKWTKEAEESFAELLQAIPSLMRGLAEGPMKDKAEEYAQEAGAHQVERAHAVAGFVIATPYPMRKHLKKALDKAGIPNEEYSKWVK